MPLPISELDEEIDSLLTAINRAADAYADDDAKSNCEQSQNSDATEVQDSGDSSLHSEGNQETNYTTAYAHSLVKQMIRHHEDVYVLSMLVTMLADIPTGMQCRCVTCNVQRFLFDL